MSIFNNNCLNKIRIPIRKKLIGVKSGELRDHLIVTLSNTSLIWIWKEIDIQIFLKFSPPYKQFKQSKMFFYFFISDWSEGSIHLKRTVGMSNIYRAERAFLHTPIINFLITSINPRKTRSLFRTGVFPVNSALLFVSGFSMKVSPPFIIRHGPAPAAVPVSRQRWQELDKSDN